MATSLLHTNSLSKAILTGCLAVVFLAVGCGQDEVVAPPSLDAPSSLAVAVRDDCGDATPAFGRFADGDGPCAIGLITNAESNRLAVADLRRREPSLVDLDQTIPSTSHVGVGKHPIDVAASVDGTVAYTLNSVAGNLSVVDLWRLAPLEQTIDLPGSPKAVAAAPSGSDGGSIIAVTHDPDTLWVRDGIHCDEPENDSSSCSGFDGAQTTQLPLPGGPADVKISADETLAYVIYNDRDFMSAFLLPGFEQGLEEGEFSCRGGRQAPPCEVRRIGLSYGCSDGLDNDGDGKADQADPQCWGPKGAESPDGIGRSVTGACADGEDNDGDGQIDRDDEDCQSSADDSEEMPLNEDAVFACSNGNDDDGDGATDFPEDASCYGPQGERESDVEVTGFESIGVGQMGVFVYIVDQGRDQILTVDAQRLELIDAGRTVEPHAAPFTDRLGIPVPSRPKRVTGFVTRNVPWVDPDDPSHGIVRHDYGAYVATDGGRLFFVKIVSSDCQVRETGRSELLSNADFTLDSQAFQNSKESECLTIPEFPLPKREVGPCQSVEECEACLDQQKGDSAKDCTEVCADFEKSRDQCRVDGRRLSPDDDVQIVANPRFGLADGQSTPGRVQGPGTCTEPDAFIRAMRGFASQNPEAPQSFDCLTSLRHQPLRRFATDEQLSRASFDDVPRADLLMRTDLRLRPDSEESSSVTQTIENQPYDFRFRSETWTATYEGVLPSTNRDDGLLDPDTAGLLDTSPLDLCNAGVKAGDRIIIKNEPESGEDAPEACEAFQPDDSNGGQNQQTDLEDNDPFLTYRVARVRADTLEMEPLEAEGTPPHADTLPTRECFPTAIKYEIRAENEWIVSGEESGFLSPRTSELGACVPALGAESRQLQGRVRSGGFFNGPYLEFQLFSGPVAPLRRQEAEYEYNFTIQRFFNASRFETASLLPTDLLLTPDFPGGTKVLVSDGSEDFVWLKNLTFSNIDAIRLR